MAIKTQEADTPTSAFFSVSDLATYLGVPVSTLYLWRTRGKGPRAFKVGKLVKYRREDVAAWLEAQAQESDP